MATTGKLNGSDLLVYVDGTAIAYSTSCSISMSMNNFPVTTKDDNGWRKLKPGERQFSMTTDGLVALDATYGVEELWGIYNGQTEVTLKCSTDDATDRFFEGKGLLASLDLTFPQEDAATFTASFDGSGKLSFDLT